MSEGQQPSLWRGLFILTAPIVILIAIDVLRLLHFIEQRVRSL